jgi:nitroimidazol reductase NimA-like FMN-containing flavoprotein (pyridoxamine 5'-phosphate oxidase superfamily)
MTDTPTEFGRLRGAGITRQLPRAALEDRIAAFLRAGNVCVIATCLNDVPQATPIEYYADGLTVYVAASRGTKLTNLEGNPRIGVAIYNKPCTDWTDWYEVKGVQIAGTAELLRANEKPGPYAAALQVYDWRMYRRALGKSGGEPPDTTMVKVVPQTIMYRDLGLLREGYAVVQVWRERGGQG